MALPTKEKTWQYTVNQACGNGTDALLAHQDCLFKIKNAMRGFALHPWTVWGSNDGQGAGHFGNNDGVDRWVTSANLIWGTGSSNHSWIVLKQDGLGTNTSICYDCATTAQNWVLTMVLFPTGVETNGTATARPSATDELVVFLNGYWSGAYNSGWYGYLHVMESSDGQCTRVVICRQGYVGGWWGFDVPKNPVTGWSLPMIGYGKGQSSSTLTSSISTYASHNDTDTSCLGKIGSVKTSFFFTSEGWSAGALGEYITYPDDDTAEYPFSPIYLASSSYIGTRGPLKGTVYDMWWGSTFPATGDCYPADGSRTFAQFGHLILPWDGSLPLVG